MRQIIGLCFLLICSCLQSQGLENGAKHLGAGAGFGAIGGYAAHKIFNGDSNWVWAGAVGGGLAAGLAKETYDVSNGGEWQTDDVVFSALGGFLSGLVLDVLLEDGPGITRRGKRGGRRGGSNCGCLVVENQLRPAPVPKVSKAVVTAGGTGNLEAGMQAAYMLKNGL